MRVSISSPARFFRLIALFALACSPGLLLWMFSGSGGDRTCSIPAPPPPPPSPSSRAAQDPAAPSLVKSPVEPPKKEPPGDAEALHRFSDGMVAVLQNVPPVSLGDASEAADSKALEAKFELASRQRGAVCSTVKRFGRKEDGGWDLCLVGPYRPVAPCFSFSFGVNNIWEFDEEVVSSLGCHVVTFDPSMSQKSYWRKPKLAFIREGLDGKKGKIGSWPTDTLKGYLERYSAQNLIVDILKIDIEGHEWASLATALDDGSLKLTKQLLLEVHANDDKTRKLGIEILARLHTAGFRIWHHNWNTYGNYASKADGSKRTCCFEIYFVNIHFLSPEVKCRNDAGARFNVSIA